ncbi:SDR family oxidoreductase [Clostridium sp. UBA4548]|uniref:SDR family oxidoreductase n=1 Tax=Clostridium sp. UBA4548 TaxID=1946361 RepID=UPI0025C64290|nr:sugar nucleotide-binding protein [Clostridium sp. UBA4548]
MDKILITGGKGFFASRFNEYYKDKYDIISLSKEELNIADEKKVISKIKEVNPKFIVHTAAIADTQVCEKNPEYSFEINVTGSKNIAKASDLVRANLIHISSEQVYNGNLEEGPYDENTIPVPDTVYGKQKLLGEQEVSKITEDAWILRFNWLFSFPEKCGRVNANIIWNITRALLNGEKMRVPSNEYRGMTYIYDLLKNFNKIFEIPFGIYNTGSESNLSTYDVAKIILEEMDLSHKVNHILIKDEERYKERKRDLRISNLKLKNNGIVFLDTEEAVKRCIKDFGFRV